MERHKKKVDYAESNCSFPIKLFALMANEDGSAVQWVPHGFAFKISDPSAFMRQIVPKYFRHTKLTSFQRQLNLYGFRRVLKGDDEGAYFHPKFQRGKKDLIAEIQRLPAKQNLMSLQEVMDAHSLPTFQLNTKKRKASSPPLHERTRGRMKATSSNDTPEQKDEASTIFPVTATLESAYTRTNPRPKRTVPQRTDSAHPSTATAAKTVVPRKSRNSTKSNCPSLNPSAVSASSGTDEESSYGEHHPSKLYTTEEPESPLFFSAASPATQVGKFKPSSREEHDDYLDLSLTSPLFGVADMMDGAPLPRGSSLPSPTALAVATAQADFGSALVQSQHAADFAGLGHQQDLAWTQHYSLGALGSLPLITDYTPGSSARASGDSDPSRSASSGSVSLAEGQLPVVQQHVQRSSSSICGGAGTGCAWSSSLGPQVPLPAPRDAFDDLLDFFDPLTSSQDVVLDSGKDMTSTLVLAGTSSTTTADASSATSSGSSTMRPLRVATDPAVSGIPKKTFFSV